MAEKTEIAWCKPGPSPAAPRDGDKKQARQRINVEVRTGYRSHPNTLPCKDCGHVWRPGERRHEYDHFKGYAAAHHYDVEPVCTLCHAIRDSARKAQTHCSAGHEFTVGNTYLKSNGTRSCRECMRIWDRSRQPRGVEYWKCVNGRRRAKNG